MLASISKVFAGIGIDAISASCEAPACEQRQVGHVGPTSPACMNFLDKVSAWDAGGRWERPLCSAAVPCMTMATVAGTRAIVTGARLAKPRRATAELPNPPRRVLLFQVRASVRVPDEKGPRAVKLRALVQSADAEKACLGSREGGRRKPRLGVETDCVHDTLPTAGQM